MKWERFEEMGLKSLRQCLQATAGLALTPKDTQILLRLVQCESRKFVGATLSDADGYDLVEAIVATGRAFLLQGNRIRLSWGKPLAANPVWQTGPDGVAQPCWDTADPVQAVVATAPPCYIANFGDKDCIGPLKTPWSPGAARDWTGVRIADSNALERFVARFIHLHPQAVPPERAGADLSVAELLPVPVLRLVARESALDRFGKAMVAVDQLLLARLRFRYGAREICWRDDRPNVGIQVDGQTRIVPRQTRFEADCVDSLRHWGLRPKTSAPDSMFDFNANDFEMESGGSHSWSLLLAQGFSQLAASGWECLQDPNLCFERIDKDDLVVGAEPVEGNAQWQSFAANIRYRGNSVPVLPLLRDFIKANPQLDHAGLREVFGNASFAIAVESGERLMMPGRFLLPLVDTLFELGLQRPLDRTGRLRVSRWRAKEIDASLAGANAHEAADHPIDPSAATAAVAAHLPNLTVLRERILAGGHPFKARPDPRRQFPDLREYQCTGVGWMEFLDTIDAHGILADDMGLGKTFQVLAYIARRYRRHRGKQPAAVLIVCPTSVMDNWQAEARARACQRCAVIVIMDRRAAVALRRPSAGVICS